MTTNQTEYEHNLAWYRRHSIASPGFRMSCSDSEAKRERLRREALDLVLDDRFCFLAKQSWEFRVENEDAVIRGQWGKVKFNKPRDDRSDGESYLMKCFAGGLLSDLCVICHGNRYVSNPNGKFPDACHNCNFSERITGDRYGSLKEPQTKTDEDMKNTNDVKGTGYLGGVSSFAAHYAHMQYEMNHADGLEGFDKDCLAVPGEFDTRTTLRFVLDGESFDIGACELRRLLRAHKVEKARKPEGLRVLIKFDGGYTREEIIYPRAGGKDEQ